MGNKNIRIIMIVLVLFFAAGGIISRLFVLQIWQYDFYSALAKNQHELSAELFPDRGEIYTQDLSVLKKTGQEKYYPLAINKEFYQVYIAPKNIPIDKKEELSQKLSELLGLDKIIILEKINKPDDPYELIKNKVDKEIIDGIKKIEVSGVGYIREDWRYYPYNNFASHIVGFVGMSESGKSGQYGLERSYEDELKGRVGLINGEKDVFGYWIPSFGQKFIPAVNGERLVLTIDQNIQFKAEKELKQIASELKAQSGTIIVMEPATGAIRAMANWPDFDPNNYNKVDDIKVFLNPSIEGVYEPGSVFKAITMAAGLDSGKIKPETTFNDTGSVALDGHIITNALDRVYGVSDMTKVLEKSINTGAVFAEQAMGKDIFIDYIRRFGFGSATDIDLPGEVSGDISNLFANREINLANISFGQGISVTPIQLISAISAIANKGKLMQPYLVEKIIHPDNNITLVEPKIIRQIISVETSKTLIKMLVNVVNNGQSRYAQITGYDIAGKTGTAQMPDLEKGGYGEETNHTFVGFAPAYNPKFAVLIRLEKPQGVRFADTSTVPVFKKMAEYLLSYFEIAPGR